MDYEIEWGEAPGERCVELCVDPNRYAYTPKVHLRYLDFTGRGGKALQECCCVTFRNTTPEEEGRVMQTVLMMAKARYGL